MVNWSIIVILVLLTAKPVSCSDMRLIYIQNMGTWASPELQPSTLNSTVCISLRHILRLRAGRGHTVLCRVYIAR